MNSEYYLPANRSYSQMEPAFASAETGNNDDYIIPMAWGARSRVIGSCQQYRGDTGQCVGRFHSRDVDTRDLPIHFLPDHLQENKNAKIKKMQQLQQLQHFNNIEEDKKSSEPQTFHDLMKWKEPGAMQTLNQVIKSSVKTSTKTKSNNPNNNSLNLPIPNSSLQKLETKPIYTNDYDDPADSFKTDYGKPWTDIPFASDALSGDLKHPWTINFTQNKLQFPNEYIGQFKR